MAAQTQACGGVVQHHFFGFVCGVESQRVFAYRRSVQERRRWVQRRRVPDLLAAVAAQAVQRVGCGQCLEVAGVQRAALRQLFGAGKGLVRARSVDARCHGGMQAADHAQA